MILVFTSRPPLLWWLHSGEGWMVKFCFLKFSLPFLKILFILFLTVLGLCCCVQAFSSCSMPSFSPRWVLSLHSTGCRACRLQLLCSMWNLPGPEIEFVSPALAFLTTGPPGKSTHLGSKMGVTLKNQDCPASCGFVVIFPYILFCREKNESLFSLQACRIFSGNTVLHTV